MDQQEQSKKQHLLQDCKAAACAYTCKPSVVTWWCGPRAPSSEMVKKLALQLRAGQGLHVALVDDTLGETITRRQATLGAAPGAICLLADVGADPRALDSHGATALHHEAQGGHTAKAGLTGMMPTRMAGQPSCSQRCVEGTRQQWCSPRRSARLM